MNHPYLNQLTAHADEHFRALVELRKILHQAPEVAMQEFETTTQLATFLTKHGLEPNAIPGGTGLTVDLVHVNDSSTEASTEELPVVCLRADIDAIENQDKKQVPYRSRIDGRMHGCGHDVHSSILCGALMTLDQLRKRPDTPSFRVRGIFQPAEETAEGAQFMIRENVLKDAAAIFALHVDPHLNCGTIGLRGGVITAICDEIEIVVTGRSGHAARPYETIDPIQAVAQLINSIYVNVPRAIDARKGVVVTLGQIEGGNSANVIPARVRVGGTLRCHDPAQREWAKECIEQTVNGIAQTTKTKIDLSFGKYVPAVNNSWQLYPLAKQACELTVGNDNIHKIELPSMGGEDFAFYQQEIDGLLYRIGSSSAKVGNPPLHSSLFDVDPRTIHVGMLLMARSALLASRFTPNLNPENPHGEI